MSIGSSRIPSLCEFKLAGEYDLVAEIIADCCLLFRSALTKALTDI